MHLLDLLDIIDIRKAYEQIIGDQIDFDKFTNCVFNIVEIIQ